MHTLLIMKWSVHHQMILQSLVIVNKVLARVVNITGLSILIPIPDDNFYHRGPMIPVLVIMLLNNCSFICQLERTCSSGGALGIAGGPGCTGIGAAFSSDPGRGTSVCTVPPALVANGGGLLVSVTCNGGGWPVAVTCNGGGWPVAVTCNGGDWFVFVTCNEILVVGGWRLRLMHTAAIATTMTMITTAAIILIINTVEGVELISTLLWTTATSGRLWCPMSFMLTYVVELMRRVTQLQSGSGLGDGEVPASTIRGNIK